MKRMKTASANIQALYRRHILELVDNDACGFRTFCWTASNGGCLGAACAALLLLKFATFEERVA